jgi:hypothetical protein
MSASSYQSTTGSAHFRSTYLELDETLRVIVLNSLVFGGQLLLNARQVLPHLGDLSYELLMLLANV